jgi:hypothetical protein
VLNFTGLSATSRFEILGCNQAITIGTQAPPTLSRGQRILYLALRQTKLAGDCPQIDVAGELKAATRDFPQVSPFPVIGNRETQVKEARLL